METRQTLLASRPTRGLCATCVQLVGALGLPWLDVPKDIVDQYVYSKGVKELSTISTLEDFVWDKECPLCSLVYDQISRDLHRFVEDGYRLCFGQWFQAQAWTDYRLELQYYYEAKQQVMPSWSAVNLIFTDSN